MKAFSAASGLAKIRHGQECGRIVILTGARGAGKTSWCRAFADLARRLGLTVGGLVSPAVFRDDQKIAIDLHDLGGGQTRRLAERPSPGQPGTAGLGWRFAATTLAWGNQVIGNAGFRDLLLIDELGPLEFRENRGLTNAFAVIERRRYRLAVVVIRPELIAEALRRWPEAQVVEFSMTELARMKSPNAFHRERAVHGEDLLQWSSIARDAP